MTHSDSPSVVGSPTVGTATRLLLLALFAGLLGMHALTPATMPGTGRVTSGHPPAAQRATPADGAGEAGVHLACPEDDHGGVARHADSTCAATGTSAPYSVPALAPAISPPTTAATAPDRSDTRAAPGRAPPDLAELQLLRI